MPYHCTTTLTPNRHFVQGKIPKCTFLIVSYTLEFVTGHETDLQSMVRNHNLSHKSSFLRVRGVQKFYFSHFRDWGSFKVMMIELVSGLSLTCRWLPRILRKWCTVEKFQEIISHGFELLTEKQKLEVPIKSFPGAVLFLFCSIHEYSFLWVSWMLISDSFFHFQERPNSFSLQCLRV